MSTPRLMLIIFYDQTHLGAFFFVLELAGQAQLAHVLLLPALFGLGGFLAAVGLVFISYAGVTKIAAIAEEVGDARELSRVEIELARVALDEGRPAELATLLPALVAQKVPRSALASADTATLRHLEALGDRLPGLELGHGNHRRIEGEAANHVVETSPIDGVLGTAGTSVMFALF